MKFDDLFGTGTSQIPAGATITNATLELWVVNNGDSGEILRLNAAFNEGVSGVSPGDTWNDWGDGLNGHNLVPGVQAGGTNPEATVLLPLAQSTFAPVPTAPLTINVTSSLQHWSDNPNENFGWLFRSFDGNGWDFRSSENPSLSQRPLLTVEFETPESESALVSVDNVAPTFAAPAFNAGGDETLPGGQFTFSRNVPFVDPGTLDEHTVTVNYGDGTGDQTSTLLLGDRDVDLNHTYTQPGNYAVSITIEDDDLGVLSDSFMVLVTATEVEFTAAAYDDIEGVGISLIVELERSESSSVSQVLISILGGTAAGANTDYNDSAFPLPVTFNVGESNKSVEVPIVQENLVELDETIIFEVTAVSGATIGPQDTSTLTILNDDQATLSIADAQVVEGDGPGMNQLVFDVTLDNPVDVPLTVDYQTLNGTAMVVDNDYIPIGPTALNFAGTANEIQPILVNVVGDDAVELDETLSVVLNNIQASGRAVTLVGIGTATGTVLNDDAAPVADADGPYTIDEGDSLVLDASSTTDADSLSLSYRWDVDGDNDFDENVIGVNPTISWTTLVSLGIDDGPDGPRTITVEASDGTNVDSASTTLIVENVDPTAVDDVDSASEDGPSLTIDVLNNDTDPAGANDPLTVTSVDTTGTLGLVSIVPGGVSYDPNGQFEALDAGDSVTDTFTYSISDGEGGSATATVTVTINGENDTPTVANPIDDVTANEDALDDVIDLSNVFDDIDADDTLTLSIASVANPNLLGAAIVGTDLILDYLLDQSGSSQVTIRATDSSGEFVEDTFTVNVLSASDQIQDVLSKVQAFQGFNTNGLQSKLNGALTKIGNNQTNAAINQLNAFINQINAFLNSGKLTAEQGAECIAAALAAITSLNEGSGST